MTEVVLPRGRSAKIVATLGPGSRSPETMELLARAGVDVFRMNFSHGSHEDHKANLETVRRIEEKIGRPIAALADLQGPKIRVGQFPTEEGLRLGFNGTYKLVAGEKTDEPDTIPVPHPGILDILEPGDEILLNDGMLQLTVQTAGPNPTVKSAFPGKLTDRKGFTVRGKALPVAALTDKDKADLDFALSIGVDIVALSFVQRAEDIEEAKAIIGDRAPLVAKLEKPAAIQNLDAIIEAADAVMVARGDLGVEYPPEQVPVIQRKIIRAARAAGRPVIVATQMLESMVEHAAPTRAEATDVATAIYQGADAVMLSAETAVGRHPATVVAIMDRIIKAAESAEDFGRSLRQFDGDATGVQGAIDVVARGALDLAKAEGAGCLALRTGSIERLARFTRVRAQVPIVYGSVVMSRLRQAQLLWGVHPYHLVEEFREDWAPHLTKAAGFGAPAAYARWRGGDDRFAWEMGVLSEV